MIPHVTVLQLDTGFPRIAGDVGSPDSYARPPQIIRICGASVARIVTDSPESIDIAPFEEALAQARGDIIVTSCGFLSYWQAHLAAMTDRPFISSSLTALDDLAQTYAPDELRILTFDEAALGEGHLGKHQTYLDSRVGLPEANHLRQVIKSNRKNLDRAQATDEITALLRESQNATHRHILLECTNLPPYRAAIRAATGLPVTDILTCIETICPGAIAPEFS
ncbi:aspartate/glutamate racemase family protein [Sulfitobacter guttiformis]|uniref:Aspartate/glutamate racemase family protein n=1 Tax=Sulfitobacter guttiformis TaxID=74349 RepID=A0A420DNH4_9RHOB|nr:hypothetical protein [Sulfitobacter guttiformis]KIN73117.1 hypothetical protein Z949_2300 [Sulfitobacter guttiformis KCTC 32187]RKE95802.1 hypothetical protein C8N30_0342 [Sulfitobacter guttiformis]